jgi:hypothetical protein
MAYNIYSKPVYKINFMRIVRFLLLIALFPFTVSAQNIEIKEGSAKMAKTKLWCFSTTYKYDKSLAVETIEGKLASANLKRSARKKGFSIYRGVSWSTIIPNNKADYYYKVRGKKGKTTFYFCASKGYDNYVTTANEPELARNIVTLLQTLDTDMATAASIRAKELELKSISEKNADINKQLEETKKQESQKAKEIDALKKKQAAPDPVK